MARRALGKKDPRPEVVSTEVLLFGVGNAAHHLGTGLMGGYVVRVCSRSSFPNGDTPVRATNDVTASSRDQVNRRARSTTQSSATSTRGPRAL